MGRSESGVAALAFLDAGLPVDVVFTDIVMPGGMDGIDLAVVVRLRWPATGLLLTSAHVDLARRREFENVLADVEPLAKPFQLPGLLARDLRLPPHILDGVTPPSRTSSTAAPPRSAAKSGAATPSAPRRSRFTRVAIAGAAGCGASRGAA
jgi:CheY-like chemotaxis protein